MLEIDDMINSPESHKIRRSLAVKMILCDFKTGEICSLLNVSEYFLVNGKSFMKMKASKDYD